MEFKRGNYKNGVEYKRVQKNTKNFRDIVLGDVSKFSYDKDDDPDFIEQKFSKHKSCDSDTSSFNSCASRHNFWAHIKDVGGGENND